MSSSAQDKGAVLITGTSSGMGRASALLLDKSGYRVFAGVRKETDAQSLRQAASEKLTPVILDITIPEQIVTAVEQVRAALGPQRGLKGLVNNAGICEPGPIEMISVERFRKQMEVNVIAHVGVIKAFLPMIRQEPGRIINVSSAMCLAPFPCFGAYAASKAALEAMSDSLRRELSRWKIPVSIIEPGTIEAAIWDTTPNTPDQVPELAAQPELMSLYDELSGQVHDLLMQGRKIADPPEVIAGTVKRALEARWPKARYQRGPGAKMAMRGTVLPDFVLDFFIDLFIRKRLPSQLMGW
jgi:NAD(P)-dependent dehydrogenase (short-subunit alcohol dehydrogenase family)